MAVGISPPRAFGRGRIDSRTCDFFERRSVGYELMYAIRFGAPTSSANGFGPRVTATLVSRRLPMTSLRPREDQQKKRAVWGGPRISGALITWRLRAGRLPISGMMMPGKRRVYEAPFKAKAPLAAAKGDRTTDQLASQFGIHTSRVTAWKKQLMAPGGRAVRRWAAAAARPDHE